MLITVHSKKKVNTGFHNLKTWLTFTISITASVMKVMVISPIDAISVRRVVVSHIIDIKPE